MKHNKKSHNKKRNVGIIYEQLLLLISEGLVSENYAKAREARKIIKKYFSPGTELYREYRLFNAMATSTDMNPALATQVIKEAQKAARSQNSHELDREKSRLIKEINRKFGKTFYNRKVSSYRVYATVQTLLNEWRKFNNGDIGVIVKYENILHQNLISESTHVNLEDLKQPQIDNLVVSLMTKKFNKKYGKVLSETQQKIIKEYVFSQEDSSQKEPFKKMVSSIHQKALSEIKVYSNNCKNQVLQEKITPVLENLKSLNTSNIDDDVITRVLTLCQLHEELVRGDDDE